MRRPTRWLFERLGWVRTDEEQRERYEDVDRIIADANREIEDARRRRGMAIEVESYRRREARR